MSLLDAATTSRPASGRDAGLAVDGRDRTPPDRIPHDQSVDVSLQVSAAELDWVEVAPSFWACQLAGDFRGTVDLDGSRFIARDEFGVIITTTRSLEMAQHAVAHPAGAAYRSRCCGTALKRGRARWLKRPSTRR